IEADGARYRAVITPAEGGASNHALVVLQRLDRIHPEKMRESEKMATVGRLLGGVVHDFANLLTLISGYSEIVLNRLGERDGLREELEEIRKAANRGARLTGQLLGFTRGQTAKATVLDLNEIVTGIVRMLQPIIGEHLNLETVLAADLSKIVADPGQMEQVLMNLVLNARDAMPDGGRILVETRNFEVGEQGGKSFGINTGPYVLLSVSDTGHGIEPAMMDRLWEPLFTTKPEGKGTGLGLSTVRKVIHENRGAVWVRSVVGKGTTFFVCLPFAQNGVQPHSQNVASACSQNRYPTQNGSHSQDGINHSQNGLGATRLESNGNHTLANTGHETVLIVEDEEGVRRLLRHVLETRGYRVLEASNGEEGLRVFRESGPIHLVLTDMIMPRMGGRELASQLYSMHPDVRIVFMSGYTDDVLLRTGELGRGMSFLQKPLRPDTLTAKVREALDSPTQPFNPRQAPISAGI
ncbi:MAG: response regulator, partial [Acidobacteriia bacterium]|nr:response regulator [Terriglobia bacterium]MBV8904324.1 response regulator [Terriglobia bacterium]